MADKDDYEDEGYQFNPDSMDNPEFNPKEPPEEEHPAGESYGEDEILDESLKIGPSEAEERARLAAMEKGSKNTVLRNALIAVAIVVLAMITYAYIWPYFFPKKPLEQVPPPKPVVVQPPVPIEPVKPIEQPAPPPPELKEMKVVEDKMNTLELSQQSMRSDINTLNNQIAGINTNINTLNAEMMKLNKTVLDLSALVTEQSQAIALLTVKLEKPVKVKATPPPKKRHYIPTPVFYLKAIVPGRAWLIASNGSTLTVRVGSSIPGYGIVKIIDAQQGRVITESGRIIRFSQDDS